ncbi:SDR family oxidoreductase [Kineosporia succinea]|uniref:NAD(P)-dependent dehydrogenase (Short-subunit alcohol dehydrogenase family) n=1 Tax=Kineosporia succinea TaxID=84632 RepID=A0ABT9PD70_9ACTN|nr:SDR family oxidoreductase [Kineosporia succinea]MDP9830339.1 NAD(P)-dependent dehydrogenase (short-subunit alcohol dehydrogenase family) [Kineosporia succinea]
MSQTVLITGTSSGLGRATARHFHQRGWNVVATMRNPEAETELTRLPGVLVTRLDVQDTASITAAVAAATETFGRVDALVNNAGFGAYGPLESTPQEVIQRQFGVNVLGPLATIQALLPQFRAHGDGVVVNVSSIGGRIAFPLGTLYHGMKFALEGLSESLYYELAALGVRVKIVEPGGIQTDFGGRSLSFSNDPEIADYQPIVKNVMDAFGTLMAGGSRPERIAEAVFAAATDPSDRLRYAAGPDAEQILAQRESTPDAQFLPAIRSQFGLSRA